MWWIWVLLYLVIGIGNGLYAARQWVTEEAKNVTKHAYKNDGLTKRTEEERLTMIAYDLAWPVFFVTIMWPLSLVVDGFTYIVTRPALKEAKRREINEKTRKILEDLAKEEKEKFKDL
jgi:hypothetical protein